MSKRLIIDYLGVTLGVLLTAVGLDAFLVPNKIAAGGVSGIATILHYVINVPVGAAMLALNVPLFLGATYRLGWHYAVRSLYGTLALSFFIDGLAPYIPPLTGNLLLASVYGGVLSGLGLGLVFKYKGTTGGTDLAAAIVRSFVGINIGQLLFAIDSTVVLGAGITFRSAELAMYALITIFLTAWLIDLVQEGFSYAKAFIIITVKADDISEAILKQLDRGATAWKARGMYTGQDREVLLSVVGRTEVTRLKDIVHDIDPEAFVILGDVHEVLGEGFKKLKQ